MSEEPHGARSAQLIGAASFEVLTDAMPQMVWSTRPDGHHDYYNARWYEFTGVPLGSTDGEGWAGMFHPEDQPRAWERWRRSLATGEPYEVEYRLRHHSGEYRWTIGRARAVTGSDGAITRWIGTCTDIHEAKLIAERNELLSRELSHRIKNIFAVIGGLIALSARRFPECKEFATLLRERIASLGRAHEFVRPHSAESQPLVGRTSLRGLLTYLLKPYPANDDGRITVVGDDLVIDDRGATPISLLFHELITNALKHGALSGTSGTVEISVECVEDEARLLWREQGGPRIESPPSHRGFGSKLAEVSVERQLDGRLKLHWLPEGLVVEVHLRQSRLARGEVC